MMDRRTWLHSAAALLASPLLQNRNIMDKKMLAKPIGTTGEDLPVIGLGTWQTFDIGPTPEETGPLIEVLKTLVGRGGSVVDSSPMYGRSELMVGQLSTKARLNSRLFLATKVWTSGRDEGIRQMKTSMNLLQREKIDLMQIHNLLDWNTHLPTLRGWKEDGRIRYIGITHYTESAYDRIEKILKSEPIDFLQINYSISSRKAEDRIFPLAMEKNIAVLINRPFEEGSLFRLVKGQKIPDWAKAFDCASWGQFFLKFIVSHPAVTCAIPGTSKPHHMLDNAGAGIGRMPDQTERKKMIALIKR